MSERYVKGDADLSHGVDPQESSQVISDRTYVMYHGTTRRNAESIQVGGFRPSSDGTPGTGVYLSRDRQKASRYPTGQVSGRRGAGRRRPGTATVMTLPGCPSRPGWGL